MELGKHGCIVQDTAAWASSQDYWAVYNLIRQPRRLSQSADRHRKKLPNIQLGQERHGAAYIVISPASQDLWEANSLTAICTLRGWEVARYIF